MKTIRVLGVTRASAASTSKRSLGSGISTGVALFLEYLDDIQPEPPLLPRAPLEKARVRALALGIACEIHPLNNLRVLNYMTGTLCHGDAPTMADCCLIPQLFNARRFDCDLSPYPTLLAIEESCLALPSFGAAAPERQPDAE